MLGLGTALITPFQLNGEVDYAALAHLLELQAPAVDYIVVLGTTAEAATLTEQEQTAVREFIVQKINELSAIHNRRIPLVLGLGGNCTASVITKIHHTDLTPFNAILTVCPYYNKPSQEGLYQHFCAIAEHSPVPVILYNVPSRTGVNLLPATVQRIVETAGDKIMGIKEASGNMEQIKQVINLVGKRIHVISGDDGLAAEIMQAGGHGLISVASNLYPAEFAQIVHNQDLTFNQSYTSFINLLFKEGNPVGIKTALALKGLCTPAVRLPLVQASAELITEMAKTL